MFAIGYTFRMRNQLETIAPGFGARLREERIRLKLNQTDFARLAGVQRLAQGQYEAESRVPNLKYLAAVATGGVRLSYLLFGKEDLADPLSPEQNRYIDKKAFDLIEDYVRIRFNGQLSAEGRYVLFEVIRAELVRATRSGANPESNIMGAIAAS